MKTSIALVLLSALSASAFVPVHKPVHRATELYGKAKPAKSKEEDLELTRKVIAAAMGGDAPAAPKEEEKSEEKEE